MIFDELGLPRDSGATDMMDSARLAGLMVLFNYKADKIDLMRYIKYDENGVLVGVRHPTEVPSNNPKNFTRDQLVLLAAGLKKQGQAGTVRKLYYAAEDRCYRAQNTEADHPGTKKKFPNGADILGPDVMNHLRICGDLESKDLSLFFLQVSIMFNAKYSPLREPNQLICLCMMAGDDYVRMYKKHTINWRHAIREYWSKWRGEPELAEHMISVLEEI